jgi:hypothetical protein
MSMNMFIILYKHEICKTTLLMVRDLNETFCNKKSLINKLITQYIISSLTLYIHMNKRP